MTPTQEEIKSNFYYNSETGEFYHLSQHKFWARADHYSHRYARITVGGKRYPAHRVAWLYIHNVWPIVDVDHINGNREDNRICNLRLATRAENLRNSKRHKDNKSGYKGVCRDSRLKGNQWRATIWVDGKLKHLGYFATPEAAHLAYCDAAERHFGEFARAA